jgi:predicted lipoprotein with Yx(FWY)xxD motif
VQLMHRVASAVVAALAVAALAAPTAMAGPAAGAPPVIKLKDSRFGSILVTPGHRALYFWNVEKKDFKIHCTGGCAKAWPPLIVRTGASLPAHVTGIKGSFGTIKRPDGRLQVTFNRLPIYTYAHEGANQVLCDNVGGWFVVRV